MTITPTKNNEKLTLALGGRLDTTTAPELEKAITEHQFKMSAIIRLFGD